jgi:RNAse (barnase) inhibitor barstar
MRLRILKVIEIDCRKIVDEESLHSVFDAALGFPGFYGRNMSAWIDCLTYLDDPESEMTSVHVKPGETLTVLLHHAGEFKKRKPELFDAIVECSAFVNWRRIENGNQPPVLTLAYYV